MKATRKNVVLIFVLILSFLATVMALLSVRQTRALLQSWTILEERSYCLNGVNLTLGSNLVIDQIARAGDAYVLLFGLLPILRDRTNAPVHKNSIHIKQVRGDAVFLIEYDSSSVDWVSLLESCKGNGACADSVAPFSTEGTHALKIASADTDWYQYKSPNILVGVVSLSNKSEMQELRIAEKSCR